MFRASPMFGRGGGDSPNANRGDLPYWRLMSLEPGHLSSTLSPLHPQTPHAPDHTYETFGLWGLDVFELRVYDSNP